jgi:hypothetical protein
MADRLQASLKSVCSDKQQIAPNPPFIKPTYFKSSRARNLILEAEQLEEYADALEAIEE